MPDDYSSLLAISGWAAWLAKEIASKLLSRASSRAGLHGVIEGHAGIFCDAQSTSGTVAVNYYFPAMEEYPQYDDCRRFRVEIHFQLFNDTDTQCVYTTPKIQLWGVEGLRMIVHNPPGCDKNGSWIPVDGIVVPPHGVTTVRLDIPLGYDVATAKRVIRDHYEGAVALLQVVTIDGKKREFRICTSSFAGPNKVVWPERCKYPIYNLYALNERGRMAGRRPQRRESHVADDVMHSET